MQIAAHVLAYNVNRFLKAVIENIEPHVDKIYIAYPTRPWGYVESSRQNSVNPTTIADIQAASSSPKIQVVQGDWLTEEDMRNECLALARAEGFDWFLTQDADEFYTDSSYDEIKRILSKNKTDNHFKTTWYNFWKSSHFVLTHPDGSIKNTNASFAFRCKSDVKFTRKRWHADNSVVIDCPCYHYGYVMSDAEMETKISTWGHATDIFSSNWYKYKWLNWNERTINLHPYTPTVWTRAIRFPLEQPSFAADFALPVEQRFGSPGQIFGNRWYDSRVSMYKGKKSLGRVVKGFLK